MSSKKTLIICSLPAIHVGVYYIFVSLAFDIDYNFSNTINIALSSILNVIWFILAILYFAWPIVVPTLLARSSNLSKKRKIGLSVLSIAIADGALFGPEILYDIINPDYSPDSPLHFYVLGVTSALLLITILVLFRKNNSNGEQI